MRSLRLALEGASQQREEVAIGLIEVERGGVQVGPRRVIGELGIGLEAIDRVPIDGDGRPGGRAGLVAGLVIVPALELLEPVVVGELALDVVDLSADALALLDDERDRPLGAGDIVHLDKLTAAGIIVFGAGLPFPFPVEEFETQLIV